MLYIFHVNTGRMMTFDMSTALDTVQSLKDTIEKSYGIPTANQVLLVSGGEILQAHAKVFSYTSGTDTNPIFMFSTNNLNEASNLSSPQLHRGDEHNFNEIVDKAVSLPATYSTVVSRAKIAQKLHEVAKSETERCDRMVYEQHLQQQGWLAVVANIEDLTKEFRQRFADFYNCLDDHMARRTEYQEFLQSFENDLLTLDRIPLSAGLIASASRKSFNGFREELSTQDERNASFVSTSSIVDQPIIVEDSLPENVVYENNKSNVSDDEAYTESVTKNDITKITLLQWLTARDSQTSLHNIANNCSRIIDMFDAQMIEQLKQNVESVINQAKQESMREIRGVAPRFQGLDKLMCNAMKLVKEQCKIATAVQNNQTRASDLGDSSILPDLCAAHASQLGDMLSNHTHLTDIHRRIAMSKDELSNNLVARIRFMVQLQNRMSELDSKMLFFNRCLRRVQRHLIIIEQIHCAPNLYIYAMNEVIRRRNFASCFVHWSSKLINNWSGIYNDEVNQRLDFRNRFEGHFLNGLFTGLDDIPPSYAIEEPHTFDANLPNISIDDLNVLSAIMPELKADLSVPDMDTVINFCMSNSERADSLLAGIANNQFQQQIPNHPKPTDTMIHLKDGCDSETDTEEFEKLEKLVTPVTSTTSDPIAGTVRSNCTRSTITDHIKMINMETITDESATDAEELQRVRVLMRDMQGHCLKSLRLLRHHLEELKCCSLEEKKQLKQQFISINDVCSRFVQSSSTNQAELDRTRIAFSQEYADMKKLYSLKNNECEKLRSEIVDLGMVNSNLRIEAQETSDKFLKIIEELNERMSALEGQLTAAEAHKQRAVDEIRDKLERTHKTEVESLRSRFKLMSNMERSPSDTSLEKIERFEYAEVLAANRTSEDDGYPSILENKSKDTAVQQQPRAGATSSKITGAQSLGKKCADSSIDAFSNLLLSKDQEIEQMVQSVNKLIAENKILKDTNLKLQQTKNDIKDPESVTRQSHIALDNNPGLSKKELSTPITFGSTMSGSSTRQRSSCSRRMICIDGCTKGDNVLVMWNPRHNQYTILQDNPVIYFLHADSYAALQLEPPPTQQTTMGSSAIMSCQTTADNSIDLPSLPPAIASSTTSSSPIKHGFSHCNDAHLRPTPAVIGKLIEKEFCYARKDMNRYKVQRGAKFYRVRVGTTSPCVDSNCKCCSKRTRQDSESSVSQFIQTPEASRVSSNSDQTAKASSLTADRQILTSSFAQTDDIPPKAVEVFTSPPTVIDRDIVDSTTARGSSAASATCELEDEYYSLSDGSSIYHTFEGNTCDIDTNTSNNSNTSIRPVSSASSETAPVLDNY